MREFIEYLVSNIVNIREDVQVEELDDNGVTLINIIVNQEDMGILIGKEGRTIRSIRSLARAKAIKQGIRVSVNIVEDKPEMQSESENEPQEDTDSAESIDLDE